MHSKLKGALSAMVACLVVGMLCIGVLSGCGETPAQVSADQSSEGQVDEEVKPVQVRVASVRGPLSVGLSSFMADAAEGKTHNSYLIAITSGFGEIQDAIVEGTVDIAVMQPTAAAQLYHTTEGGVSVVAISSIGSDSVVSADKRFSELSDLSDKTVYVGSMSTETLYSFTYLLDKEGLGESVTIERNGDAAEVIALMSSDRQTAAVLTEPYASAAMLRGEGRMRSVELSSVWDELSDDGSRLVGGVVVVRKAFLAAHPEAVEEFLQGLATSSEAVTNDPVSAMDQIIEMGILDSALTSENSIIGSQPVCIRGEEMAQALSGYLTVMYEYSPTSFGELPAEDFYATTLEVAEAEAEADGDAAATPDGDATAVPEGEPTADQDETAA